MGYNKRKIAEALKRKYPDAEVGYFEGNTHHTVPERP